MPRWGQPGRRSSRREMALTTTVERGYLHAIATGKFKLDAARTQFLALLDVIVREEANFVLIDTRPVTGRLKMLERFLYGEFTASAAARLPIRSAPTRFAYVAIEPILDPNRLGEVTARKLGMDVRVFDNEEDALRWLLAPRGS